MAFKPQDISGATLPSAVRGYSREATDDLLKRVAWDFLQLSHQRDTLLEETAQLRQRNEELEQQVAALHELLSRQVDREDVSRVLLTNAQRTARELREKTRIECEATLKKARAHAASLEQGTRSELKVAERRLAEITELRLELERQLRQSIEAVMRKPDAGESQGIDITNAAREAVGEARDARSPAAID